MAYCSLRFQILCCLFFSLLFFHCPALSAKEKITIQLNGPHGFQFAGYYAAIENGFFAEEDLTVTLVESPNRQSSVASVLNGNAQYGISDTGLLIRRETGAPVVLLLQVFQHSPMVFLAQKNSGIKSPFDLTGKTVALPVKDPAAAPLQALLQDTLGSVSRVMIPKEFPEAHALVNGEIDAMAVHLLEAPFLFSGKKTATTTIFPSDYGVDFYGDNLFTTEKEIRETPQRAEKIRRAVIRGWDYALANPDTLISLILKRYNPGIGKDRLTYEAGIVSQLIAPDAIPFGEISFLRFEKIRRRHKEIGFPVLQDLGGFVYQPKEEGDDIPLTPAERAWVDQHNPIRLAFDPAFHPLLIRQSSGRQAGILPEMYKELERRTGIRVEIVELPAAQIKTQVEIGAVDGFLITTQYLAERIDLAYTQPILKTIPVLFAPKNAPLPIRNIRDLKHRTVSFPRGIPVFDEVLAPYRDDITVVETASPLEALTMALEGKTDAALGFNFDSYHLSTNMITGLEPVFFDLAHQRSGVIAFRKDWPTLATIFNKAIHDIGEVEMQRIQSRWIQTAVPHSPVMLTEEERDWIRNHPVVRVIVDANWAPVEFREKDGSYHGISMDYLDLMEPLIGVRFERMGATSWQEAVNWIQDGTADMFSCLGVTEERKKVFGFTRPHLVMPVAIFATDHISYMGKLDSLSGKKVAVPKGYAIHEWLEKDFPDLKLVPAPTIPDALYMVAEGKVDAFVGNIFTASYYIGKLRLQQIRVAGETPYSYDQAMAVRKESAILAGILQKSLDSVTDTEKDAIYNRWMSIPYQRGFDYKLFAKLITPLIFLIFLFAYWNRRLAREVKKRLATEEEVIGARDTAEQISRELAQQNAMMELITNAVPDLIAYIDRNWRYRFANIRHEALHGLSMENIIGKHVRDVLGEYGFKAVQDAFHNAYAGSRTTTEGFFTSRTKTPIWFESVLIPFEGENGVTGLFFMMTDVSKRKTAEDTLRKAKEVAEEANRIKSAFLDNMSQDIRPPLNAVLGYCQLIREKNPPQEITYLLGDVRNAVNRIQSLVNKALDIAGIEKAPPAVSPSLMELGSMFTEMRNLFLMPLTAKHLDFHIVKDPDLPKRIVCDQEKIRLILMHLLENAMRFTESGAITLSGIRIQTKNEQEPRQIQIRFTVSDTGPGIPLEEQQRIFASFQKEDAGQTVSRASNQGLLSTRRYARAMGGDITIESQPEKGSAFSFDFPALAASPPPESKTS